MTTPALLDPAYVNRKATLPFGLRVSHVETAVAETYRLCHGLNRYLVDAGFPRLEQLILGNSLSGITSEFLVKNIAAACPSLVANRKVGGHPDLIPAGKYPSDGVLKGHDGLEVKASIHKGGWQGHNPERCWLMVFRYSVGGDVDASAAPLTFVEILCAELESTDWSFSGRKGASRRTPTASITRSGVEKLRSNFVYRLPGYGVGRHTARGANDR